MSSDLTPPPNSSVFSVRAPRAGFVTACAAAALALALIAGGTLLYLRRPPLVGSISVVSFPPDATITFDGKPIGESPQTIENVAVGPHVIRLFKEGYILLERTVFVEDGQTLDVSGLVLKPIRSEAAPPAGTPDERIAEFLRSAEAAGARGDWLSPENDNAVYYADAVLAIQPDHADALRLRDQARAALLKQSELTARTDLAAAQALYAALLQRFPDDPRAVQGALHIAQVLESRRGQIAALLADAQTALAEGRLVEPANASAHFYVSQALAIDRANEAARLLRLRLRRALHESVAEARRVDPVERLRERLRNLTRLFPEDQDFAAQLRRLNQSDGERAAAPAPLAFSSFAWLDKDAPATNAPGTLSVNASGVRFAPEDDGESVFVPLSRIGDLRYEGDAIFLTGGDQRYRFRCASARDFVRIVRAAVRADSADSRPKP
jgi:hypothetical protein